MRNIRDIERSNGRRHQTSTSETGDEKLRRVNTTQPAMKIRKLDTTQKGRARFVDFVSDLYRDSPSLGSPAAVRTP